MNLLITGAWNGAKDNIHKIEQMGHSVVYMQYENEKLPCPYEWVEGIICNGLFQHHRIEKFNNLKYIQLTSAGFDRVPMEYVNARGINIYNAHGVYSIPMAEFAVGGVLQLYKQYVFFQKNQKLHRWEKHRGLQEMYGKTVCIVGCGSIGTECAIRFRAFGCKIIGVDLFPRSDSQYDQMFGIDKLNDVLPHADIIILTLPLTEDTWHLMNSERFGLLKQRALFINIARGALVDTDALIDALKDQLGGAVLDVFEEEPLNENSPLWNMGNLIVTPHNSFVGENTQNRLIDVILKNLKGWTKE